MIRDLAPIWNRVASGTALEFVKDTVLTVATLFAQFFGTSSDSPEHFFHLALLLG
jgi:hypothetical protein